MAGTSIKFNNFELQNSDKYLITNIDHRMLPQRDVINYANPRRGSVTVVDSYFTQKEIIVEGRIVGNTEQELTNNINDLKRNLLQNEGNLDIEYGGNGEYLRYKATVSSLTVEEAHYNTTRLPFTINFTSRPYGTSLTSQASTRTINSSTYSATINVGGSFGPYPKINWSINSGTINSIEFINEETNDWIKIEDYTLGSGDEIIIDCEKLIITLNDQNIDFKGVFPKFSAGENNYKLNIEGSSFEISQEIEYFETFI